MKSRFSKEPSKWALQNEEIGTLYWAEQWFSLKGITVPTGNVTSDNKSDTWTMYDYGHGQYKIVYTKKGSSARLKKESKVEQKTDEAKRFLNSVSRARSTIFEIATCNNFEHFCTFTLDKEKRDRFNLEAFRKDFTQFIRDINKKRPENEKIKYLLIPEQHNNGAWHLHGLLMNLTDEELRPNEHGYLDWIGYRERFGFFSVSPINDTVACAKYITKYITKDYDDSSLKANKHLFFASKGLKRKECIVKNCAEKCPINVGSEWDFENEYIKVKWLDISKK